MRMLTKEMFYKMAEDFYEFCEYPVVKYKILFRFLDVTYEDRLVPIPIWLLLTRRNNLAANLEKAMLDHYGKQAYYYGHFWDKSMDRLPQQFISDKTRRWFHTIKYINQFRNTKVYLHNAIEWLVNNRNRDGLWDYGP